MRTAVIAGASGMIGSELCRQLASPDSGFDRVVAFTRRPLDFSSPKVLDQHVDFGRLDALDIGPVDVAFCTLGTTLKTAGSPEAFRLVDYDYTVAFARFARKAGARTFVLLTSVDSTPKSSYLYLRVKGETELAVEAVGFESVYIFRPSLLVGKRCEVRIAESIAFGLAKVLQFALIGGFRKYRPITAEALARGMLRAGTRADHGRTICHYDDIIALARG